MLYIYTCYTETEPNLHEILIIIIFVHRQNHDVEILYKRDRGVLQIYALLVQYQLL